MGARSLGLPELGKVSSASAIFHEAAVILEGVPHALAQTTALHAGKQRQTHALTELPDTSVRSVAAETA